MKNILSFDDFILKESIQLNEGLLQNLFGALFGHDMWSTVKGENIIKDEFKKIDDKLNGFNLTKIKNPNASQDVRQTLVDWADEIYKAKKKLKEETDKDKEGDDKEKDKKEDGNNILPVLIGSFKFEGDTEEAIKKEIENNEELKKLSEKTKDEILTAWKKVQDDKELSKKLDELKSEVEKIDKKYQKTLDDVTGSSADLKRWANILKDRMNDIIDKILCGKYDEDSELAKDLEKIQGEKEKKLKEENEEEIKIVNEKAKVIDKQRKELFSKCNIKPTDKKTAPEFLNNFVKVFDDKKLYESFEMKNLKGKSKISQDHIDFFKDSFGIDIKDDADRESVFKTMYCINRDVLSDIDDKNVFSNFEKISGESIHAFFVSYCNLLFSASNTGDKGKLSKEMTDFIAHCAMSSTVEIGFGLPFTKETENNIPKEGEEDERVGMLNYYIGKTQKVLEKSNEGQPISNALSKLVGDVVEVAKEIKEKYEKEQEKEADKEKQEEEKEDK
jgi:hypothetical protein